MKIKDISSTIGLGLVIICTSGCTSIPDPNITKIGKVQSVKIISTEPNQSLVTTKYAYVTVPFLISTTNIPVGTRAQLERDPMDGAYFLSVGKNLQLMATNIKFKTEEIK
jgi:hypothetical protein